MADRIEQHAANEKEPTGPAGKRDSLPRRALAIALLIEAGLIQGMSGHGDFLRQGEAWRFVLLGIAAGAAYWIAAVCFATLELTARQKACVFWLTAVALRVVILPVAAGDDVWRYRWEGMIQLHGINPYAASPDAPDLAELRNADWAQINHRDYAAIYPPLTETIFAAVAAAGNSLWFYKALFALADLAGIAVLRRLLLRSGLPAERAAWYAWNPLAIYVSAGAAHFDCLMTLALLGAIWALERRVGPLARPGGPCGAAGRSRSWLLSASLLGVAIAIKIVPLALVPVWVFALRSWRRVPVSLVVIFAPLAISALIYGFPDVPVFSTLRSVGSSFRVNDPFWWLIDAMGGSHFSGSNVFCGVCGVTACVALAYRFRHDWPRGLFWVYGTTLLLGPVVHAWYVVWILPIAAWRGPGARAWFVFSISTFGYYLLWEVNHASGKPWAEPLWLRLAILLPPLGYLLGTKLKGVRPER